MSDNWQPIETAPKDGTTVLLSEKWNSIPIIGRFARGKWVGDHTNVNTDGDACVIDYFEPTHITHWMPLPEPPKQ